MDLVVAALFALFLFGVAVWGLLLLWVFSPIMCILILVLMLAIVCGGGDGTDIGGHV
jgi:hypothetical protein